MQIKLLRFVLGVNIALGASIGAAALPALTRAADPVPSSLDGEQFAAADDWRGFSIGSLDISGGCTPTAGETFTLAYEAGGPANGPYPGTFTETGLVTLTVLSVNSVGGALVVIDEWTAEFQIDSPLAQVSGTTALTEQWIVACSRHSPGFDVEREQAQARMSYQATIRPTTGGTFSDRGTSDIALNSSYCTGPLCASNEKQELFSEGFSLSTGVVAVIPEKSDCKQGGYADFNYDTKQECKDAVKDERAARR